MSELTLHASNEEVKATRWYRWAPECQRDCETTSNHVATSSKILKYPCRKPSGLLPCCLQPENPKEHPGITEVSVSVGVGCQYWWIPAFLQWRRRV